MLRFWVQSTLCLKYWYSYFYFLNVGNIFIFNYQQKFTKLSLLWPHNNKNVLVLINYKDITVATNFSSSSDRQGSCSLSHINNMFADMKSSRKCQFSYNCCARVQIFHIYNKLAYRVQMHGIRVLQFLRVGCNVQFYCLHHVQCVSIAVFFVCGLKHTDTIYCEIN